MISSIKTNFPRKKTINKFPEKIEITRTTSREFKQDNDKFDPFISASPPNDFMEKLTERYNKLEFFK